MKLLGKIFTLVKRFEIFSKNMTNINIHLLQILTNVKKIMKDHTPAMKMLDVSTLSEAISAGAESVFMEMAKPA